MTHKEALELSRVVINARNELINKKANQYDELNSYHNGVRGCAYVILCDLWMIFPDKVKDKFGFCREEFIDTVWKAQNVNSIK